MTGPGGTAGAAIAAHAGIGKVAFTGETGTGQEIMRLAAANVKKISLELGGKSPNVVFADADLERFAAEALMVKVGDPADEATEVGTMVSFRQRETVLDYIRIGREEGANVVVGGGIPSDPALAGGAYIQPTVFDGGRSTMRIAQEEIFGPVVVVIPFDTEEEAVRLANATPFGLSGSVWTRDIAKAIRTARGIQSGVISVNCNSSVHAEAPFGGYKMSGMGRENGMHAFESYTQIKNVYVDLS